MRKKSPFYIFRGPRFGLFMLEIRMLVRGHPQIKLLKGGAGVQDCYCGGTLGRVVFVKTLEDNGRYVYIHITCVDAEFHYEGIVKSLSLNLSMPWYKFN